MQSAIDQFQISIGRVRDLVALHNSIKAQATSALDVSDILRAALVLSVSALDYYIHEVVTLGMLEIYGGQRPEPTPSSNTTQSAFSRFQVSLGAARQDRIVAQDVASWLENEVQQNEGHAFLGQAQTISAFIPAISNSMNSKLSNIAWLEREIRDRHSYQSFQQPDKIAEAIRLISDKKLWEEVAHKMGKPNRAKEIKQELSSIVDRRNKIAHEADIDPSYNIGNRWPIDEIQVDSLINFIQQVVESIHQVIV
jgi:hypothetical protein